MELSLQRHIDRCIKIDDRWMRTGILIGRWAGRHVGVRMGSGQMDGQMDRQMDGQMT